MKEVQRPRAEATSITELINWLDVVQLARDLNLEEQLGRSRVDVSARRLQDRRGRRQVSKIRKRTDRAGNQAVGEDESADAQGKQVDTKMCRCSGLSGYGPPTRDSNKDVRDPTRLEPPKSSIQKISSTKVQAGSLELQVREIRKK